MNVADAGFVPTPPGMTKEVLELEHVTFQRSDFESISANLARWQQRQIVPSRPSALRPEGQL